MSGRVHFGTISLAQLKCLIAVLCLGLVTGTSFGIIVMGRRTHHYYHLSETYKIQLSDLQSRNERLEQSLQENRYRVIKRIVTKVEGVAPNVADGIQKKATALLSKLIGREISVVDPVLIETIVNQQVAVVDGRDYVLTVRSSHVWETLTVVVSAVPRIRDRTQN